MANETILNYLNKTVINGENSNKSLPIFKIGDVFDKKYEVIEVMSYIDSGEADLYKVKKLSSDEILVLKIYRRENAIKDDVLKKITQINNINVGKILDSGKIDRFAYIVTPFYKVGSLENIISQNIKFKTDMLKSIIKSLNEGINAIHSVGIFHKDVKPANMMISDDGSHVILIDFGISSATNGRTVVATQTGKTPFYSAPETNLGLFSKESDYYSLGITIYELVTGTTPYQNTSIENLQQYQQIQQIPFPDDFDEDLKDLISALTYKDISYRNDKSNPNRRWCYDEVRKWLNGEKQPIPGSAQTSNVQTLNPSQIPYMFKGKKYFNLTELIINLLLNWDEGKKEVFRYNLSKYFELIEDKNKLEETDKAAKAIEEDDSLSDSIFFDLMYRLAPEIKHFCWQGYFFESVYDYGDKLLNEILEKNEDTELLKTSQNPIVLEKLEWFAHHANENPETYAKIIANLKTLLTTEPLEIKLNAMRVGYALTNKELFKIGDTVFETITDFNSFLEDLYNSDLLKYRDFCINNDAQIKEIAKLFAGEKRKQFEKNLITNKQTIEIGKIKKFYFRDYEEIAKYVNLLWNKNRLEEFHFFTINCIEELRTVIEERNLQNIFNEYLTNVSSYLCINEYIFKDIPEFKNYWEHLSKRQRKEFVDSHGNAIDEALSKRPVSDRNIIDSLLEQDLKMTHNLNDFKVGNIVTFGNYAGPIEWQVLEVKDNKALLLSKHILFRTAYDKNGSGKWKTSSLRQYLNGEFYEKCFTKSEKNAIVTSNIKVNNGDTKDRIYLLSIDEVNKYFKNDQERIAVSLDGRHFWWWLRCRSRRGSFAAHVRSVGLVSAHGSSANNDNGGVRVAFQLNLVPHHSDTNEEGLSNKPDTEQIRKGVHSLQSESSHGNRHDTDKKVIDSHVTQPLKTSQNINDFKVGNIVTLGNYKGPIEWQVLDVKDNKALLLSKHILFKTAYDKNGSGTWNTSSLRQYLNGEFYENCFTQSEKNAIITSNIKVNSGDTKDRIYLLSVDEVNKYFKNNQKRIAVSLDGCEDLWWLRCRGGYGNYAACVSNFGGVYAHGINAYRDGGVRVAFQLNLVPHHSDTNEEGLSKKLNIYKLFKQIMNI